MISLYYKKTKQKNKRKKRKIKEKKQNKVWSFKKLNLPLTESSTFFYDDLENPISSFAAALRCPRISSLRTRSEDG